MSFVAAVGALSWQIAAFFLSGGRVKVELILAELVPYAGISMLTTRDGGVRSMPSDPASRLGPGIELAQVLVENPGRLAVTITRVELEIVGATEKGYFVTPRLFAVPNIDASSATRTHLRLEPYEQASFLLDFWSVIEQERVKGAEGQIQVRARVKIAGGKFYRSPKSTTWSFGPADLTSRSQTDKISVSDVIMREVMRRGWRNNDDADDFGGRYPLDDGYARKAGRRIARSTTREELKAILLEEQVHFVDATTTAPMSIISHEVHEFLARHADDVLWES